MADDCELDRFYKNDDVACTRNVRVETSKPLLNASEPDRKSDTWGSRIEFLLAIIGYTIGIGSIWRFPILCARNGGGAFLIPFVTFMVICGGPLYYLEVCLGQFTGKNPGVAFEFCPLLKGVGLLMVTMSINVLVYYSIVMGWAQYYFVQSFMSPLPWTTCGNWWNTERCQATERSNTTDSVTTTTAGNYTTGSPAVTSLNVTMATSGSAYSPAQEFWMYNVLRQSGGIEDMGSIQWHLLISNFIAWSLVVASLAKGAKSLGKVVYVTATAPYVLLTILLVRGMTLDGAVDGVLWYITPDFTKLANPQVWLDAALQVFFSLGPSFGGVIAMASHNKFHQRSFVETTICVAADTLTSIYAGLVVFACLGFMAKDSGISIEELAKASGTGLAFVAYPEAISRMPLPQLWGVMFFLMLISAAYDSFFGMVETVSGTLVDMFPRLTKYRLAVLSLSSLVMFLAGVPVAMNGGIYVFNLFDWYAVAYALFLGSALECIMVAWIYGSDRFAQDIQLMTGRAVSVSLRVFWGFTIPGAMLFVLFFTIATLPEVTYGKYQYPKYAVVIGIILAISPTLFVAFSTVWEIWSAKGTLKQRIVHLTNPSPKWQPNDASAREVYRLTPYRYEDTLIQRVRKNILGDKDTPWI